MGNKKTNKRQFTLIELIIVIVVIGILAAMALPKFIGVIRNAKVASMEQDLDVLEKAVMQYVMVTADGSYPFLDLNGDEVINEEDLYFKTSAAPQSLKDSLLSASGDSGDNIYKLDMDKLKPYIDKIKYPNVDYVYSPDSDTAIDPIGRPDADDNIHHIIGGGITEDIKGDVIGYEVDWGYRETTQGLILNLYKKQSPETLVVPNKLKLEDGRILKVYGTEGYHIDSYENNQTYNFTKEGPSSTLSKVIYSDGIEYIGDYSLRNLNSLTEVKLPSTLKKIGNYCFVDTPNLSKMDLPSGLAFIGSYSFMDCGLEEIIVPDSVTTLMSFTFSKSQATNIVIGNGVTEIPWAMINLSPIKSLTLGDNITTLPYGFLSSLSSLEVLNLGENLTTFDTIPFSGCPLLKEINFSPNSKITTIKERFFEGCKSLKKITIPDSVVEIKGISPFEETSLEIINLGSGLTTIPSYFFDNSTNLKEINFSPNSKITKMGNYVFSNCPNLETLTIPDGVAEIGSHSFENSNIKTLNLPNTLKLIKSTSTLYPFNLATIGTLKLGIGMSELPMNFFRDSTINNIIIPEGIKKIGAGSFNNCNGLISVLLPESLTSIDGGSFSGMKVETFVIPNSITKTTTTVPLGSTSIKNLYLGSGLTELPDSFLQGISNLTTLTFSKDNNITKIGRMVLAGTQNLTSITIPSNVVSIDKDAFLYSSIKSLNVVENSYADTWCHENGMNHTHITE